MTISVLILSLSGMSSLPSSPTRALIVGLLGGLEAEGDSEA